MRVQECSHNTDIRKICVWHTRYWACVTLISFYETVVVLLRTRSLVTGLALFTDVQKPLMNLDACAQSNGNRNFLVLVLNFYPECWVGVRLPLSRNARALEPSDRNFILAHAHLKPYFQDGGWRWTTGTCLLLHVLSQSRSSVSGIWIFVILMLFFAASSVWNYFIAILSFKWKLLFPFPLTWISAGRNWKFDIWFVPWAEFGLSDATLDAYIMCVVCYVTVGFGWVSSRLPFRNKNMILEDFVYSLPFHSSWERYYSIEERGFSFLLERTFGWRP